MKSCMQAVYTVLMLLILSACGGGGSLERDGDNDGGGGSVDPAPLQISMTITNEAGEVSTELATGKTLQVAARVTNESGTPQVGQLVTFTFNTPNLATFSNDVGTANTNAEGIASIGLSVGQNSGSGQVIATLGSGETGQIGFNSSGTAVTENTPASLAFFASSTQLASSGTDKVELIALVKNEDNVLLEGINVDFSANSNASIETTRAVTGADGTARALLDTRNRPENRVITATAKTVNFVQTLDINVTGTQINLNGPSSVIINDTAPITIVLADSDGKGIANQPVQLSTTLGSVDNANPTTGPNGQVSVTYSSTLSGEDTITATALNAQGSANIAVQEDDFAFTTVPQADIPLGTPTTIVVSWSRQGLPFVGGEVTLTASRGVVATPVANTAANGQVSFTISSDNAGPSSVSATGRDNAGNQVSARIELEFIATNVDTILVDASPDLIGPEGQTSTISAVVRDPDGNLVKGEKVQFNLSDVSGGKITPDFAITDSNGLATTVYTSNAASSEDAVMIVASSDSNSAVSGMTTLTVGDRAFDISIGTGREILLPDDGNPTYIKQFAVFVSDAAGRPVPGVSLSISATPVDFVDGGVYRKGFWQWDTVAEVWVTNVTAVCANEDIDGNGIRDAGEDTNGDGKLTPGNIGVIRNLNSDAQTNENGQATLEFIYPKNIAPWTEVAITAFGESAGSETFDSIVFSLAVLADDVDDEGAPPPPNPYGRGNLCTNTD